MRFDKFANLWEEKRKETKERKNIASRDQKNKSCKPRKTEIVFPKNFMENNL